MPTSLLGIGLVMRCVARTTLMLLLLSGPASAQIGPPMPRAQRHGYSLGVGVHNVSSSWAPNDYDIARNRLYFEGSYGFSDRVEGFARAGISDWVVNDVETYRPGMVRDISTDGSPPGFVAGGLRGEMARFARVTVGGSVEAAWHCGMDRFVRWNYNVYQELLFDPAFEITAAFPVGCDLGRTVLYGGPLLHFGYSRLNVRTHTFDADWEVEDTIHALTLRDKAGVGGFLGWRAPLGEKGWHLQLEAAGLRGGFAGALGFYRNW